MLIFRAAFTVGALAVVVGWPGLSWGQGQRGAEAQKKDQPKSKAGGELQRGMQGGQGRFSFERIAERHDANKDGKITREEWKGPPEYFDRMDRNGDGVITADDFKDGFPGGPGGGQQGMQFGGQGIDPASLFRALDANGDGKVSKEELEKFFNRADSDKDGSLSQEELQAMLRSQSAGNMDRFQQFRSAKPAPGQPAPDFKRPDLEGRSRGVAAAASAQAPNAAQDLPGLKLEKDARRGAEGAEAYTFTYAYEKGKEPIKGILLKPPGNGRSPAVVVNHGGGGNAAGPARQWALHFVAKGYVAIACDLTHTGKRGERDPKTQAGSKENAERILACIKVLESLPYVDPKKLCMYGNSMGAFATVGTCTQTDKIKAAAITAGGITRTGAELDQLGAVLGALSTEPNVPKITAPFMIVHGSADNVVKVEWAKNFKAAMDKNNKVSELKIYEGVGHGVIKEREQEVFALILEFFDRHLGAATASDSPPSGADEPTSQSFDRLRTGSTNQPTSPQVRPGFGPRWTGYPQARPAVGEAARDFVLEDLEGNEVRLNDFAGKLPVVIEFGSYT